MFLFIAMTADPRNLHSFPTRRSSDLDRDVHDLQLRQLAVRTRAAGDDRGERHRQPGSERSEEHTSELQSQSKLVCRLLLEKKKKGHCDDVIHYYVSRQLPLPLVDLPV